MLEVRYQNTVDELRSAVRVLPRSVRLYASSWVALLLFAGLVATLLFGLMGNVNAIAGGWTGLGVLASFIKFREWRSQRLASREFQSHLLPTTVRIGPHRFEVESDRGWLHCDWSMLEPIMVKSDYIYFTTSTLVVFVVPKRAFPSQAEADQFARSAITYQNAAKGPAARPFVPSVPPLSPNEDALRVTYRNTPDEFVSVQFEGLQKNDRPAPRKVTGWGYLRMIVGSVVLALVANWGGGWLMQMLVGSAAFFFASLATFAFAHRLLPRLARPTFERRCRYERTLTISAVGISIATPHTESSEAWLSLGNVDDDERFVAFFDAASQIGCLVPKHAFGSADLADRFARMAKRHWEDAHPAPALILAERVETGNPYQSPTTG